MIALSTSDLGLAFGADVIFEHVTFAVNDGERVGIVGVNGAGKTSLFRCITGETAPTSGAVYLAKGHTVGMLSQNVNLSLLPAEMTMGEYMVTAFPDLLRLEGEIKAAEDALARTDPADTAATLAASDALHRLTERFGKEGGYEFRSRARGMLLRLGFTEAQIEQKIGTLSGGQYTRLSLARLLATEPDILMLDEPTNHLDIDALAWLESFLSTYKKTVLIISHDRYFLDRTTDRTLVLEYGHARLYHGNFSASREQREAEAASLEKRYKEQQKVIARIRENIEFQRRCNREHNFVTIRAKEKQLARMEKVELAPPPPKSIRLMFAEEGESAGDVIVAKDLSFSYGGAPLMNCLSFLIKRYEKVLFLGPNGSGKSTLMKLLVDKLTPTAGKLTLGYNVKIGYYDQEIRTLDDTKTVYSEMRDAYPDKKDVELRSTLALFLFGADDLSKSVSLLSGGERARLTLAKLILKKVNLLILDEPTNHLDIASAEALENALLDFDGTVVAVSHDRYFINRLATRIIELAPETEKGMIDYPLEEYDDAYTEYMRIREARRAEAPAPEVKESASKNDYLQRKAESAAQKKIERQKEKAKERIPVLEAKLEELDRELFGEAASDYLRAAEIDGEKAKIEEELMALYELVL